MIRYNMIDVFIDFSRSISKYLNEYYFYRDL